jgi:predicted nucleic acid-binding Zn finger protein
MPIWHRQLSYRPDSLMYGCLLFKCKQLAVLLDHHTMYLVKMQFCACSVLVDVHVRGQCTWFHNVLMLLLSTCRYTRL